MSLYYVPTNLAVSESGFLFAPGSGETFTMNKIAMEIFQMLKIQKNEEEIIHEIIDMYNVDLFTLQKDLQDFIGQLKHFGLIKES